MTLEREYTRKAVLPNIAFSYIIFAYSAIIVRLPLNYLLPIIGIVTAIIVTAEFAVSPFVNHLVVHRLSERIEEWKKTGLDETKRTQLLESLMHLPVTAAIENIGFFASCSVVFFFADIKLMHVSLNTGLMSLAACLFGTFASAIMTLNFQGNTCSDIACRIVEQGVDREYVMRRKYFGVQLRQQLLVFVIIPVIATNVLSCLILIMGYMPLDRMEFWPSRENQIIRMALVTLVNILMQVILSVMFYARIRSSAVNMSKVLEAMKRGDIIRTQLFKTSIDDEIAYNFYLINQMLLLFRSILEHSTDIGRGIMNSSGSLMAISKETAATALEQSAGAREIVSTMENAGSLSHDIESKIQEVTTVAEKTAEDVGHGSQVLDRNLQKMSEIVSANETTIRGIREVTRRINGIWEIVNIISSVADQTKIIAFNAELEAATVHDAGNDFRNVANEIRRLAGSTMDSTREIRERITEIQTASDSLIKSSLSGTDQVNQGMELAHSLEQCFSRISESSQTNAAAAGEIQQLISQQTAAFEQIVITIKQISAGVENFSVSAQSITDTAAQLRDSADKLGAVSGTGDAAAEGSTK